MLILEVWVEVLGIDLGFDLIFGQNLVKLEPFLDQIWPKSWQIVVRHFINWLYIPNTCRVGSKKIWLNFLEQFMSILSKIWPIVTNWTKSLYLNNLMYVQLEFGLSPSLFETFKMQFSIASLLQVGKQVLEKFHWR